MFPNSIKKNYQNITTILPLQSYVRFEMKHVHNLNAYLLAVIM